MTKEENFDKAISVLKNAGYRIKESNETEERL